MIQEYLHFLAELELNNNRDWFDLHRQQYKELSQPLQFFVGDLIQAIATFDSRL
jgi:uncharacterized protein (DUF2461 family)